MQAHGVHVREGQACEVHAYEMHAYEISTHGMYAGEVHAFEILIHATCASETTLTRAAPITDIMLVRLKYLPVKSILEIARNANACKLIT